MKTKPTFQQAVLPAAGALALIALLNSALAKHVLHFQIQSFSVGPDLTLTYPNTSTDPSHLG